MSGSVSFHALRSRIRRWIPPANSPHGGSVTNYDTVNIVPEELWVLILRRLPDETLLRAAAVCRIFNRISTSTYIERFGTSPSSLAMGNISGPCQVLRALLIAYDMPPIERITASFALSTVNRGLQSLRAVLTRFPTVCAIHLTYDGYFFPNPRRDPIAFTDITTLMAIRVPGPLFVLEPRAKSTLLKELAFSRGPRSTRQRITLKQNPRAPEINDVNIRLVKDSGSLQPYTLAIFNAQQITSLTLSDDIDTGHLSSILANITLPNLTCVYLPRDCVDPTSLGDLFLRHPRISTCVYPTLDPPIVRLTHPPISHPGLLRLSAATAAGIQYLLELLGSSPNIELLSFPFDRSSPAGVAASKAALQQIALRLRDTQLHFRHKSLHLTGSLDDEEIALAKTLFCVHSVVIHCTFTQPCALVLASSLVAWLALLPMLQRLTLHCVHEDQATREDRCRGFRAAFPRVPEVLLS
ncbi:hypothetical protein C8J57DRAFT_1278158 [Mycena rebaudengoi]|nr:hypothetical protein C8J57DRAFT_1278158 [Mycena rebaudengoi]